MLSNLPTIRTVIVNWNLKDDTLTCIDSLFKAGIPYEHIILIDNGSEDGLVDVLRNQAEISPHIIENPENLGYVIACNQGIQYALNTGAEWVMLLNNDTLVAHDFLIQIKRTLLTNFKYAILGALIFYHTEPDRIWYLGERLIPGTLITKNIYRGKPARNDLPELIPVDFVNGCAMLIQRNVFEKIGLFDPSLIMYSEEVDFCWRARQAGYRIACATKTRVWHKISLSANRDKTKAMYLRTRNQVRFYNSYSRGPQRPIMFLFSIFRNIPLVLRYILHRQPELISSLIKGLFDGWSTSRINSST